MRVTVLDDWPGVAAECADWSVLQRRAEVVFQREALCGPDLVATLKGSQILLPMRERSRLDAAVLGALPDLRLIALTGATTRHIDMDVVQAGGITLCWSGAYHPEETAEFVLGLILAAEKHIPVGVNAIARGGFMEGIGLGRRMGGRTLGILGFGRIGARLARMAQAMDMAVIGWGRSLTPEVAAAHDITAAGFDEVLATSDIVSVQMFLSPETEGRVGRRELALMKPGALLVNTARGPLVDETALIEALQQGHIRAALDVFDIEPLPANHPLRHLPNALLTPHLGYATRECMEMFYGECIENILAWMDGNPIRVLDKVTMKP
ncbi:D-2-hydroxyacid dehydrogenase family protein [Rhizobium rhizogenes]|uniref:D-2-hydroxyacid dehydrogenase family protein n=1 Tax=Rhizobium rhizogenes TaxID=359 RepID=UPI0015746A5C|nr:D-2-hydroxyacid dehydrogenase family protein [Rhizobium rhizogenes]NTF97928.1 D-2-hydroxyacid dehydrogenase family protein [Rhizobium rhizogenes]